ncbi:hypothetical protein P4123_25340 [Pseudomonas aeruginosa]|nr:hypothetical protein [Pseudomonas aeruginosa]
MVIGGVLMIAGVLLGPVRLIDEKQESQKAKTRPKAGFSRTLTQSQELATSPLSGETARQRLASSGL